jgi:hypothetical protein
MHISQLTFDVVPTDPKNPLGFEVWMDNNKVVDNNQLSQAQSVVCKLNHDVEQLHQLKIIVKNKTSSHTQIDNQGNIIQDSLLEFSKFCLDEIDITKLVYQKSIYSHDFNGTAAQTNADFFGNAGCNGTITFEFSSPAYLWLLENM